MDTSLPHSDPPNHVSNVLLPLHHALSLQLTWRCNARCRFCGLKCSPESAVTMELEVFEKILEEVCAERPRVTHIELTGGEIFTEFELLEAVAHRIHAKGLPYAPITNCFWASSVEKAKRMLARLPGIWQIVFSHDSHHREFIPERFMVNAMTACRELGIHFFITCGYFEGERPGLHLFGPEAAAILAKGEGCDYHFYPALDIGRARTDCRDEVPYSYCDGPCLLMSRLEVTPDGTYGACCIATRAVDGGLVPLMMGSAREHTEPEMCRLFKQTPLYVALATIGPLQLYRRVMAGSNEPEPDFRSICSPCIELCTLPDCAHRVEEVLLRDNLWPVIAKRMYDFYQVPASELPIPEGALGAPAR